MGPKTNAVLVPGVRKVASSHAVMLSHPQEAAALITLAADAVADSTKSTRVSVQPANKGSG